ncbi:hypothetical protein SHKM778_40570 [Streptomyces sp. KM77-8]|uniref:RNA polymerase sigma-70 region 2 domain-containing protein n=1 Tax=Streptomyces haneummycinicus TaxID=3074435 RepID=A0AAT9HJN7_9ACTN
MLIDSPTHRPGPSDTTTAAARRRHDDAPDTAALFARLTSLEDGPERDAVRDELVTAWLPMAHRIAGRFRDRGEAVEDLRQVAALGLVKAIDRFDPGRGPSRAMPSPPSPARSSGTSATGCGPCGCRAGCRNCATRCGWPGANSPSTRAAPNRPSRPSPPTPG